ncbi:protein moonraker isoform X2 [Zootoca vivipara]|uniref:protein moonraker isoform X2 n=1 Tax=Zootoca vivipara TaxID=8524 RepID=UPI00293C0324|nr:protein moonraker isoform X2 [Zootoca vivipara]
MGLRKPAAVGVPSASHLQPDKSDGRAPQSMMQLQFSRDAPALPENLAVRYSNPRPIIIEKLAHPEARRDPGAGDGLSSQGSMAFSIVSEEKLNLAVQLARRDMKRRHLEEQVRQHFSKGEKGPLATSLQGKKSGSVAAKSHLIFGRQPGYCPKVETTSSGAKVYLYTPSRVKSEPFSDSPPTRDPGPGPPPAFKREEDRSTLEIRRLQKELQNYIQKIDELVRRERSEEILDPDEERRIQIRRQEQAVRSARMLYVLQQQVKEIEDDLEKLSPRKIKHTKKSRAMARLAAAHRGAVRALQVFASRFADQPEEQPVPAHCKELGHLIRQLSLCSARLETDSSSLPDRVVDLLLQIEDLDSLLSKKESPKKGGAKGSISTSQATSVMDTNRWLKREKKAAASEPRKPPVARRLLPDEHEGPDGLLVPHSRSSPCNMAALEGLPIPEREAVGQAKWEALGHVKTRPGPEVGRPPRKRGVLLPTRPQGNRPPSRAKSVQLHQAKQARFQEPTIAFRLKETKPPTRDIRVPWVPPSLSSPLASPQRDDGASAAQIAETVERAVRERLEPLLANAQKVNRSLERNICQKELACQDIGKAPFGLPRPGLEDFAELQREEIETLSSPSDLEVMLQRMEEIERSQEAVRRRYHQIVYSDAEFWARQERWERENAEAGQEPRTPHPIQITRRESHPESQVDIVLETPLDTNAAEEEEEESAGMEELLEPRNGTVPPLSLQPRRKEAGVFLSVPKNMLQSIHDYSVRYNQHLRCISHEAVGSFNPWRIAESLAEELTEEALADVATELQVLCEDYAEAVFTSEFLEATE